MTHGIHHVTAIAGPAQRNLDFYTRVLGLRLVKRTVNFDDPTAYHFYYGDETGRPGTLLTFFPWEHAAPGRPGSGETRETLFRIPEQSLAFWSERLAAHGVGHQPVEERFGERVLSFADPDGTRLALVAVPRIGREPAWTAAVADEHAIRGLHSVVLGLLEPEPTAAILTDVFGFAPGGREGTTSRFVAPGMDMGGIVDLRTDPSSTGGRLGRGSVHHVAFRADDAAAFAMQKVLAENHGIRTTDQKDRNYFRSLYFREPGGVLFEIATDIPGFAIDEPVASLGGSLRLPPQFEPRRKDIEAALPVLAA